MIMINSRGAQSRQRQTSVGRGLRGRVSEENEDVGGGRGGAGRGGAKGDARATYKITDHVYPNDIILKTEGILF
jgi:hypothetical protein